jgi:hypothetical protein
MWMKWLMRYFIKMFSAIAHALDEVNIRAIVINYVEAWFLLLIKGGILYLNGEVILVATNFDHF